jgi:hypothetical protein
VVRVDGKLGLPRHTHFNLWSSFKDKTDRFDYDLTYNYLQKEFFNKDPSRGTTYKDYIQIQIIRDAAVITRSYTVVSEQYNNTATYMGQRSKVYDIDLQLGDYSYTRAAVFENISGRVVPINATQVDLSGLARFMDAHCQRQILKTGPIYELDTSYSSLLQPVALKVVEVLPNIMRRYLQSHQNDFRAISLSESFVSNRNDVIPLQIPFTLPISRAHVNNIIHLAEGQPTYYYIDETGELREDQPKGPYTMVVKVNFMNPYKPEIHTPTSHPIMVVDIKKLINQGPVANMIQTLAPHYPLSVKNFFDNAITRVLEVRGWTRIFRSDTIDTIKVYNRPYDSDPARNYFLSFHNNRVVISEVDPQGTRLIGTIYLQ